jgi:hypothetical protein
VTSSIRFAGRATGSMRLPRLVRTAAFRLASLYAAIFAMGAMALVAFFDWTVSNYASNTLNQDISAETQLLRRYADDGGASAVATRVRLREEALGARAFQYVVADRWGRRLAGALPLPAARLGPGRVLVPAPADSRESADETAALRTLGVRLPDGGVLVVGRSTYGYHELGETMTSATIAAAVLVALMAVGIAVLFGREFLSRIDRVNVSIGRVMEGRLEERLPAIGMGDEFDQLAANLNAMLDRIQQLMEGLRQASSDIAHDLRTPLPFAKRAEPIARRTGATLRAATGEAAVIWRVAEGGKSGRRSGPVGAHSNGQHSGSPERLRSCDRRWLVRRRTKLVSVTVSRNHAEHCGKDELRSPTFRRPMRVGQAGARTGALIAKAMATGSLRACPWPLGECPAGC